MRSQGGATRQTGETLRDFYIRLQVMANELGKHKPTYKGLYDEMARLGLYYNLPPVFQTNITADELANGNKLLQKVMKLTKIYLASKLRDEDIYKEKPTTDVVNAVASSSPSVKANQIGPSKQWRDPRTYFVYRKPGHLSGNCYRRQGGSSKQSHQNQKQSWGWPDQRANVWDNWNQPGRPQCTNCGKIGHKTEACYVPPGNKKIN